MKFNIAAVALLAGSAYADDQKVIKDESSSSSSAAAEPSTKALPPVPTFTVSCPHFPFPSSCDGGIVRARSN